MRKRSFIECDVFTSTPTKGNGLAVVLDGEGLTRQQMQDFAAWTNFAETTFLAPADDPRADYHLHIYTPKREMLFAGHPTLGSCAAWLHAGGQPKEPGTVRQKCGVGIVDIDITGAVPAFIAPPTTIAPMPEESFRAIAARLGLDPATVVRTAVLENGPVWHAIELQSAADVLAIDGTGLRYPEFVGIGLIGAHEDAAECDYEVRMLAPSSGMDEDPITGSLNAALAHWLKSQERLGAGLVHAQGTRIGRAGRVHIREDARGILIGGETQIMIEGTLTL